MDTNDRAGEVAERAEELASQGCWMMPQREALELLDAAANLGPNGELAARGGAPGAETRAPGELEPGNDQSGIRYTSAR